jgi:MFS family permease
VGSTPLFVINTITFLGVVLTIATTPDAPAPERDRSRSTRHEIGEAAGFIFMRRGPLAVFAAMVMMSLLAAPLMRMLPLYVIDVYGLDESRADFATGMLISVLGIGAVLGGLALRYLPAWYPKHHFIPLAIFGAGMSITVFSLTTTLAWGYAAMFVVGAFWIWGFNPAWAAMQHLVSDAMRGRVLAIANVAAFGVTAFGNVAAGWLGESVEHWLATGFAGAWAQAQAKALGTHAAVGVLSVMLAGAGVVMMIWRVPEVDGLPRIKGVRRSRLDFVEALLARQHWPADPEPTPEMQGREPV